MAEPLLWGIRVVEADTAAILMELGTTPEAIAALDAAGVIQRG